MKHLFSTIALIATTLAAGAAGTLQPVGSGHQPIRIRDHHVAVVINNGFARTEVTQTFANPNPTDLEALYSFPLPVSASLSEVTILVDEQEIHGEVLPKERANQVYREERDKGNNAGVANKDGYKQFEFAVARVPANGVATIRFVYYQPLSIDTGVARYLYPLQEGGTDEGGDSFWNRNSQVDDSLTMDVEIKSAWPIDDVRLPYYRTASGIDRLDAGHLRIRVDAPQATLDQDFVLYYRLADNLPGRIELMAYRPDPARPGTFMMVVTPGLDLQPLNHGADYVFVLDKSGSMNGKLGTLADAVVQALGKLPAESRFRIITFDSNADDLMGGWLPVNEETIRQATARVKRLRPDGSTNIYDALKLALRKLDDDRATSLVLVTDGVANTGVVDPRAFRQLLEKQDIRVFGFLMGNSANWPLMRLICEASGGFYAQVSNNDDILGQILMAQSKISSECLHGATLKVAGVEVFDRTDEVIGKVYRGQQLVVFGRYRQAGEARVTLAARLTGEDKTYETTFDFPEVATDLPELERLWAMNRVEAIETARDAGLLPAPEAKDAIRDLGVQYQIVTDETSMVVLSDGAFAQHGIERRNETRLATEHQAQAQQAAQPPVNRQADTKKPAFHFRAPSIGGGGGGAFDPLSAVLLALFGIGATVISRRK